MKALILNGGPLKKGATDRIIEIVSRQLSNKHQVEHICLGEKIINYCIGCKSCYIEGVCCQSDDTLSIVQSIYTSDVIITVVPSYWADVPGQMKVFIDRCTPFSNTNPNRINMLHKTLGYSIVLRTGPSQSECEGIIKSINHFYGHMDIVEKDSYYFCGIKDKEDVEEQKGYIISLCENWFGK